MSDCVVDFTLTTYLLKMAPEGIKRERVRRVFLSLSFFEEKTGEHSEERRRGGKT